MPTFGTLIQHSIESPNQSKLVHKKKLKSIQALGPGALGKPRGSGWRGRWAGGLGWGTHVKVWLFHFNV